jgi:hypothetical protein
MLPDDAPAPASIELVDGVPCGWCFERSSWPVHRAFYRQFNRPMAFGEYSKLLRDRSPAAECLSRSLNVWRLSGNRGETVIVQRAGFKIRQILPPNWTSPSAPSKPVPAQPRPKPASSPPSVPAQAEVRRLTPNELRRRLGLSVV